MTSTTRSSSDSLDYSAEEKPNMNAPTWAKPRSSSFISQTLAQPPVQESHVKTKLINGAYIAMNTFSTVAIVFLNKVIFQDPQLKNCQVSTAMYHFSITFLVLLACSSHPTIRLFDAKRLPLVPMLPICLFFAGSIVLSNLSLAWNSVGFFQLTKILTTPCVVLLGYLMFRVKTNNMRLVAVAACCIGVAMTNTKQAITNPIGAIVAVAAFSVTALYQIYIGRQMKVLAASAPQLLMNQAPISVVLLAFIAPFVDVLPNFSTIPTRVILAFLLSGLVAAAINYSQFMIIGRTSPLTFNIVGMAKISFILVLSYFFEDAKFSFIEVGGILLALSGTWIYGQYPDAKKVELVVEEQKRGAGSGSEDGDEDEEEVEQEALMGRRSTEDVEMQMQEKKRKDSATAVQVRECENSFSSVGSDEDAER